MGGRHDPKDSRLKKKNQKKETELSLSVESIKGIQVSCELMRYSLTMENDEDESDELWSVRFWSIQFSSFASSRAPIIKF
jgi:hypothetical protein